VQTTTGVGDLLATIHVVVPSHLSAEATKHLNALAQALPDENPRDDLLAKARS
jgi:molecular chaperone DnaJ